MRLTRYQPQDLWSWPPFEHQLTSLRDDINRLFEPTTGSQLFNVWSPTLDVFEDKDNVVITVEVPGMRKEDLDISLHDGVVSISGERKHEHENKEGEAYRSERFYGRFQRSVSLPKPVDANRVKAEYKDGILRVTLPKTEEAKPRQIEVKVD